ncbi:MAG: Asp-tRNA(Asn)/Glu-tRNA(Gln) amidotransferase subunit GatA, partial [Patescibacteria group bacterium]
MSWKEITEIATDVNSGKVTATDNVKKALQVIKDKTDFKAIIATLEKRALERAKAVDVIVKSGKNAGRLAGVPFIAKDNFLVFGAETTAASNILKGFEAPYQATAIEKLEAEGAICVAKANLDAFAHGSSTENSDFFTTLNPHDKTRVPGGSSGGSAAAVMLDMTPFALGTDTGGSVRLPASFCGVVGYKPTYGLVSRYGVVAMASSTDVIGPITKTVADAALVLDVMAGRDQFDGTTIERESSYNLQKTDLKGQKIGVVREYMTEGLDPKVKKVILQAIETLKSRGALVTEVSLPSLPLALAVYYIICPAEVRSNLARYDGQRFGHSSKKAKNLEDSFAMSRTEGFGVEAKRRIMIGTYVLSSGYYEAYYKKAALVRTKLIHEFSDALANVDFLVGPTSPITAFKIGEKVDDPLQMYLIDIMTVAANLTGNPAISVPAGLVDGLPVGLQLIGRKAQD